MKKHTFSMLEVQFSSNNLKKCILQVEFVGL